MKNSYNSRIKTLNNPPGKKKKVGKRFGHFTKIDE